MKFIFPFFLIFSIFGEPREIKEAYNFYEMKEYRKCINRILSYSKYFKNTKALALLTVSYTRLGEHDSSLYYYELLKKRDGEMLNFEGASFYAGLSYEKLGHPDRAIFAYYRAVYGEKEQDAALLRLSSLLGLKPEILKRLRDTNRLGKLFRRGIIYLFVPQGRLYELGEEFIRGFQMSFKGKFEVLNEKDFYSINDINNICCAVGPLSSRYMFYLSQQLEAAIPVFSPVAVYIPPETLNFIYTPYRIYELEIKKLVDYLINQLGYVYFGLIFNKNAEGYLWQRLFSKELEKNYGKVLFEIEYGDSTLPDSVFETVDTTLLDGIFVPGGDKRALFMASRARVMFPEVPVFGLSLWKGVFETGAFSLENFMFSSLPLTFRDIIKLNNKREEFKNKYYELYNYVPTYIAMRGYDCGLILNKVVAGKREISPAEILLGLKDLKYFQGLSSDWVFTEDIPLEIYYLKRGKLYKKEAGNEERKTREESPQKGGIE